MKMIKGRTIQGLYSVRMVRGDRAKACPPKARRPVEGGPFWQGPVEGGDELSIPRILQGSDRISQQRWVRTRQSPMERSLDTSLGSLHAD